MDDFDLYHDNQDMDNRHSRERFDLDMEILDGLADNSEGIAAFYGADFEEETDIEAVNEEILALREKLERNMAACTSLPEYWREDFALRLTEAWDYSEYAQLLRHFKNAMICCCPQAGLIANSLQIDVRNGTENWGGLLLAVTMSGFDEQVRGKLRQAIDRENRTRFLQTLLAEILNLHPQWKRIYLELSELCQLSRMGGQ